MERPRRRRRRLPAGNADLADAVSAYAARSGEWYADLVGPLVVKDTQLADVPADVPVSVVLTGGAGAVAGVATLAAKRGHRLVALEAAVRDLDDLAGNVRRINAAVDAARDEGGLADTQVYVELPQTAPTADWLAAADAVAEAEAHLKFRTGGLEAQLFPDAATVAAWIDAALDRETSYKCTAGLHHAVRHRDHETDFEHHGFLNVLLATRRAFDGGTVAEVAEVLDDHYANDLVALARTSDLAGARRWFTSYGSCSVTEPLDDLLGLGLLEAPGSRPARPTGGPMPEPTDGFGLDHLPYGVYSVGAGAPRVGVRLGDSVLDVATVRPELDRPTLNDFMALGPAVWAETRAEIAELAAADGLPATPLADARLTCRSRSATTSTSTPRSTTPPTSAGSSAPTRSPCCPTGGTSRSATTDAPAPSSSAVRRSSGRAGSGSRPARHGERPDARVRPEPAPRHRGRAGLRGRARAPSAAAGSASVTSPTTCSAWSASTTGRPATSRPGSTCRSARSSASPSRRR